MNSNFWQQYRAPVMALALGIVPFWLFVGSTNRTVINGEVVRDSSFNVLGLGLAIGGLVWAFRILREGRPWLRAGLAGVALVVCAFQVAWSAGYRVDLRTFTGRPDPASPQYSGLPAWVRENLEKRIQILDAEAFRDEVLNSQRRMRQAVAEHEAYAEACHRGRRRISVVEWQPFLSELERQDVMKTAAASRTSVPKTCTDRNAQLYMIDIVEQAMAERDVLNRLAAGYDVRFGTNASPPVQKATSISIEGLLVAVGDSVERVQTALGTSQPPRPYETSANQGRGESMLAVPGITVYFDGQQQVKSLVLTDGFLGSVGGVRIGDTRQMLIRRLGEPIRTLDVIDHRGLVYDLPQGGAVRFDVSKRRDFGDGVIGAIMVIR